MTLNLTESFAREYEAYLAEQTKEEAAQAVVTARLEEQKICESLQSAYDLWNLCDSYMEAAKAIDGKNAALQEADNGSTAMSDKVVSVQSSSPRPQQDDADKMLNMVRGAVNKFMSYPAAQSIDKKMMTADLSKQVDGATYEPVGIDVVTKMSDLGFPQNIQFLLANIIDWIKRVVMYLISKIRVLIARVLGQDDESKRLQIAAYKGHYATLDDLKPHLTQAIKKLDTGILKPVDAAAKDKDRTPVRLMKMSDADFQANRVYLSPLAEGLTVGKDGKVLLEFDDYGDKDSTSSKLDRDLAAAKRGDSASNDIADRKPRDDHYVVELDTSKDLYALQQTVTHFFDLYDQAFGSNGEKLFESSDLELVLRIISKVFNGMKEGTIDPVALSSLNDINADKVYSSLVKTKTNTDSLDKAYYETYSQIDKIMKIISSKQLMSLTQYGVQYVCMSAYTYKAMGSLIDICERKMADAKKMEKGLSDVGKKFDELSTQLEKYRSAVSGYGTISVQSIYQRKFNELYLCTKYLTQITTLRLTTLTRYINELQDIKNIVMTLADLSRAKVNNERVAFANAGIPAVQSSEDRKPGFFRRMIGKGAA